MDDNHYRELLPAAYLAAAVQKGGEPSLFQVGKCVRVIDRLMDNTKNPAYRIAMSAIIPAKIQRVERVTTSFGVDRFVIYYRSLAKDKDEDIRTPLLNDWYFGAVTKKIWDRWEPDGRNSWVGKIMNLYKHNDPPRAGEKSTHGYRCCVYAEPRDDAVTKYVADADEEG